MSEAVTDPLDTPLAECGLAFSARLYNCLTDPHGGNLKTLREVCAKTAQELRRIPNFGKTSLNELVKELEDHGLRLRDPPARVRHTHLLQEVFEFPTVHQRLTRIEQRLDALEQSSGAVIHEVAEQRLQWEVAKLTEVRLDRLERMAGRLPHEFPDVP